MVATHPGASPMSLAVLMAESRPREHDARTARDLKAAEYRYYHRLSYADIARVMACSVESVRQRLRRAEDDHPDQIAAWEATWPE